MARLFDGTVVSYDSANAKFVSSAPNYAAPFDYGTTTALLQKADMTAVGNTNDCGECHVGGGAMQYIPNSDMNARVPLRTATDVGGILDGKVTSFNYFVDVYDADGDGMKYEALKNDYSKTGVVEMDCFICHLQGYNYDARKSAVRLSMFDASRAIGANIATHDDKFIMDEHGQHPVAAWDASGYGTGVSYIEGALEQIASGPDTGAYKLASSVVSNIKATPPSDNCVHCHFAVHAVDWKKRGEKWENGLEVHYGIGCMGCHERTDEDYSNAGDTGVFRGAGVTPKLGMCDPAKGDGSAFDALSNTLDRKSHKGCYDCHVRPYVETVTFKYYNAPNPTVAHAAKGLSDLLLQDPKKAGYVPGTSNAAHVEVIACESCHVKKDASITGGAFVDGSGPDAEGRLATHDHAGVERNMEEGVGLYWWNGKLYPGNFLTSVFWRSKNDMFWDANNDGRKGGMDALLQTHVAELIGWDHANALWADGTVTAAEVKDHLSNIQTGTTTNGLPAYGGAGLSDLVGTSPTSGPKAIKLSMVTVPFKITHNVVSANQAWGAGGCADCHGADKGFYNGIYDLNAKASIAWDGADVVPFTMVNGGVDKVDTHPNMKDRKGVRSVPVQVAYGLPGLRNPDRSEFIYEATFQTRDTTWKTTINGAEFSFGTATSTGMVNAGNLLKIETKDVATGTEGFRTKQIPGSSNPTNCTELMTGLTAAYTSGFEFDITCTDTAAGKGRLDIAAKAGKQIRLNPQSDVGQLGLAAALWKADPLTPTKASVFASVDSNANGTADTRAEWVAYLDAVAAPPTANIVNIATTSYGGSGDNVTGTTITVPVNTAIYLDAADGGAFAPSYKWTVSDSTGNVVPAGQNTTYTFTSTGTFNVALTVTDSRGQFAKDYNYVKVVSPPPAGGTVEWVQNAATTTAFDGTLNVTGLPTHTRIYVLWGDFTANTWDTGTADHSVPHTFKALSSKLVGSNYEYPVSVRVYEGTTLVKTLSYTVVIPK